MARPINSPSGRFPFAHCAPGPAAAAEQSPSVLLRAPLPHFPGFSFPRSLLEGWLTLSSKQRTRLGHCFAGIWYKDRPSLALNFCIFSGRGRNLWSIFKDGEDSLYPQMCPHPWHWSVRLRHSQSGGCLSQLSCPRALFASPPVASDLPQLGDLQGPGATSGGSRLHVHTLLVIVESSSSH